LLAEFFLALLFVNVLLLVVRLARFRLRPLPCGLRGRRGRCGGNDLSRWG
jgi:hypothetical protein